MRTAAGPLPARRRDGRIRAGDGRIRAVGAKITRLARVLLYLDQNYLSGMVKAKPSFVELEPVVREAVRVDAVAIPESAAHERESAPRPDLPLLALLRSLSGGVRLPDPTGPRERAVRQRLAAVLDREHPERSRRPSDEVDLDVLAAALPSCRLVTCDAHMASVCSRARLDRLYGCELFSGRRGDVDRLRRRLLELIDQTRAPAGAGG